MSNMILFWHPSGKYGFLSQWYMRDFIVGNITFNCCEQYMMYCKAILFNDIDIANQILHTSSPAQIKAFGRKVKNFDAIIWQKHVQDILYTGNYAKFTQNEDLKNKLLQTNISIIAEASPYDKIYGIGLKASDSAVQDFNSWIGTNLLGQTLMQVRAAL